MLAGSARAYLVTGRGESLDGTIGRALRSAGVTIHGRETSALASLRFHEQLATIRSDLRGAWWYEGALLVGHSYGAYLLLHTLADLTAFPGSVVLFSPVLGTGTSSDGWSGSRPPYATRLLTLVQNGEFAAPAHLDVHTGADDLACPPSRALLFAGSIAGARCHVVEHAGHVLPSPYLQHALEAALDCGGRGRDTHDRAPDESEILVPGRAIVPPSRPAVPAPPPREPGSCPHCGSMEWAAMVYGYPRPDVPERQNAVRGGCCIGPTSPDRACRQCGLRWLERVVAIATASR